MPLDYFSQTQLGFLCISVGTINVNSIDWLILRARACIVKFTGKEDLSHHWGLLYPEFVMFGREISLLKVLNVAAKDRIHFHI